MTKIIDASQIEEIVSYIQAGKVVAFPTETVYGLGVQFQNEEALEKLMKAKNRDYSKAITLMVANKEEIDDHLSFLQYLITIHLNSHEIKSLYFLYPRFLDQFPIL